ncbi:radical SAM protein [Ethanoligenens harbinense]|nr:nitrogenase component 1 [Ethanoligenens harbinense]AVQ97425.1 nitrogen fixation protein NifN [Ethanoligenens harbinense YUAN-3]AYF40081.1 nitrogen fixation protein NifN [Ethanoligenens harbinense]AYF42913.1 nitrogen fixation protein NifN [Ethanoligenens harbinense]QCN93678.1 radical SAM protein [Ethanoligenens harbinense]
MCMPLGAVTAFYGVKGCMSIIHGSQGCSTYIRRHMATHYNEPIDIASSALTEQGTVYGGEANLLKGIGNLTKLYQPQVIGICTTCLAETIGEDVPRIIEKAKQEGIAPGITFVNVPSPGYGGSQFEGFLAATRAIVATLATDSTPNRSVNVIASYMTPAEMRTIKDILDAFELDYTLLPDISENLDRVYDPVYNRLPQDGTDLADIRRMAGARFTLEIGVFSNERNSAAEYLHETFGIPYKKVPLPIGLRGTDALLEALSEISGKPIPEKYRRARGRYLDAMVDAHKYTGEARVVVFGEPDQVFGLTRLCLEVGALPLLVATGSRNTKLKEGLEDEIERLAKVKMAAFHEILDDTDFDKIADLAVKHHVNLMIGNSDGRRVQEKTGIELLRIGFPMHDRVGGQRQVSIGYEGSLQVMDGIANAMLNATATTFRKAMYDMYYNGPDKKQPTTPTAAPAAAATEPQATLSLSKEDVAAKTKKHPCYDCSACSSGSARMHLPVAPACNIQCNYCTRDFDCPNESRPGVTSGVLSPEEAVAKYLKVKEKVPNLSVVGIAGPGDVLANFEQVKATLEGIRKVDPDVTFCVSTNGLMLPFYANDLLKLGVSHLTVTLNAVDENIGAKIYKHVNYLGKRYTGVEGARILRDNQLTGIRYLVGKGMVIKINIVMLKGINDAHIETVVQTVRDLGCEITNIMQLIPVKGSAFEDMELVSNKELMEKRKACSVIMKQMYHCKQCRADAIGTLDNDVSIQFREEEEKKEEPKRLRFAVASKSGMIVDTHFGHANEFHIYDYQNGDVIYVERRAVGENYCKGGSDCGEQQGPGIDAIIEAVGDCQGVISMRIGAEPSNKLRERGIEPFMMYDRVESGVREAARKILSGEVACNAAEKVEVSK